MLQLMALGKKQDKKRSLVCYATVSCVIVHRVTADQVSSGKQERTSWAFQIDAVSRVRAPSGSILHSSEPREDLLANKWSHLGLQKFSTCASLSQRW